MYSYLFYKKALSRGSEKIGPKNVQDINYEIKHKAIAKQRYSRFSEIPNLPNIAKTVTFHTKYIRLSTC